MYNLQKHYNLTITLIRQSFIMTKWKVRYLEQQHPPALMVFLTASSKELLVNKAWRAPWKTKAGIRTANLMITRSMSGT